MICHNRMNFAKKKKVVFNAQALAVIPFTALMELECRLFLCGTLLSV
jgi:hypothetical protein